MSTYKKEKFERAVKYGSDEDIRDAARDLSEEHFDKRENAEFAAEVLKHHKHYLIHDSPPNEMSYDGVKVKLGVDPRIEVDEDDEDY